jgi:hypothetical protein
MKTQAKESRQIQKAREKLQKTLNREGQKFTKETLALITLKIKASMERQNSKPLSKHKITIKKDSPHQ